MFRNNAPYVAYIFFDILITIFHKHYKKENY